METKKYEIKTSSYQYKIYSSSLLGVLASLAALISHFVSINDFLSLPMALLVAVGFPMVITIFTFILYRRERGSTRLVKLKDDLASAYIRALDQSPLNPMGGGLR